MRRRSAGAAVLFLLVLVSGGCGDDAATPAASTTPPGTVDAAALEAWLASVPSAEGIWAHCEARAETDPAGTVTNLHLVAWDGYALAAGPDDPALAGEWRGFVEAGTVWSASIAAGVEGPGQLEAVVSEHSALVDSLSEYASPDLVAAALPAPPAETLTC